MPLSPGKTYAHCSAITRYSPILRECFNKEIEGLPPGDENADMIAWYRYLFAIYSANFLAEL